MDDVAIPRSDAVNDELLTPERKETVMYGYTTQDEKE